MNNAQRIHKIQSKITDLRLKIQELNKDRKKNLDKILEIESKISELNNFG